MKTTLLVNTTISGVSFPAGAQPEVDERTYAKLVRLGACAETDAPPQSVWPLQEAAQEAQEAGQVKEVRENKPLAKSVFSRKR